jgi:hypothetical protein
VSRNIVWYVGHDCTGWSHPLLNRKCRNISKTIEIPTPKPYTSFILVLGDIWWYNIMWCFHPSETGSAQIPQIHELVHWLDAIWGASICFTDILVYQGKQLNYDIWLKNKRYMHQFIQYLAAISWYVLYSIILSWYIYHDSWSSCWYTFQFCTLKAFTLHISGTSYW